MGKIFDTQELIWEKAYIDKQVVVGVKERQLSVMSPEGTYLKWWRFHQSEGRFRTYCLDWNKDKVNKYTVLISFKTCFSIN